MPEETFAALANLRNSQPAPAAAPALLAPHETRVLEDAQVPCRRRPLVRKTTGDLPRGGRAAKVDRHEDLPPRRVCQRGDDGVECRQFLGSIVCQAGSTSQIVSSSSTGPIGSHTAMTSGVWCATSLDLPSFQTKYSMNCSRCLRMS